MLAQYNSMSMKNRQHFLAEYIICANILDMARAPFKTEDEKKMTRLQLRITNDEKDRLERAARASQKSLSKWVRDVLLNAAPVGKELLRKSSSQELP